MDAYELRPVDGGVELRGAKLGRPLKYPVNDSDAAIRVVSFLSQRTGSVLRIFDASGAVIDEQRREPTRVMQNVVGGLGGPH